MSSYTPRSCISACREGRGCTPRSHFSPCRAGRRCTPRSYFSACREGSHCTLCSLFSPCRGGRGCTPRSTLAACRGGTVCTPRSCLSAYRGGKGCTPCSCISPCRASISSYLPLLVFTPVHARDDCACPTRRGGVVAFSRLLQVKIRIVSKKSSASQELSNYWIVRQTAARGSSCDDASLIGVATRVSGVDMSDVSARSLRGEHRPPQARPRDSDSRRSVHSRSEVVPRGGNKRIGPVTAVAAFVRGRGKGHLG